MAPGDIPGIDIVVRQDGVYITISCEELGRRPNRKEVLDIIERYEVQDIEFVNVNDIFKSEDDIIDMKLSSNRKILQLDEQMTVEISKNRLEARVKFMAPVNKGRQMTRDDIKKQLNNAGIVYGVDENLLNELSEEKEYDHPYIIAKGASSVDGIDGYLDYHFDISQASLKPMILEDGNVDFHKLSVIRQSSAGEVLITAVPPVEGKEGVDVTGRVIPYKRGKKPSSFPRGKNVRVSEDGAKLISEVNGQIIYANNKLDVSPILEIPANVDNSTGDIDFRGTVVVRGNVLTGFTVKALGNIEVIGVVEGATLHSESHIMLCSGVQGSDRATIIAAGDITAKFLEGCSSVIAGGNIVADSILHSIVKCGDSLTVSGRKGCIVGGSITVRNKITANIIGSSMATAMDIEIGHMPEQLEEYKVLNVEFTNVRKEYDQVSKVVDMLNELHKKSPLPDDRRAALIKAVHSQLFLKNKLSQLQIRVEELKEVLTNRTGSIEASKVIYSGVKLLIGDATLYVRDNLTACKLINVDGRIEAHSL